MNPALLCLSITVAPEDEQGIQDLRSMLTTLKSMGTNTIIGGCAVQQHPELVTDIVSTYSSSLELLSYIKTFEDQSVEN